MPANLSDVKKTLWGQENAYARTGQVIDLGSAVFIGGYQAHWDRQCKCDYKLIIHFHGSLLVNTSNLVINAAMQ